MNKKKIWCFPISAKIMEIKTGKVLLVATAQLYQTGIHVCLEGPQGNPRRHLGLTPAKTMKCMEEFTTSNLQEGLQCEFGRIIYVTIDKNELYKEVKL